MKAVIVVPTIRRKNILDFLEKWRYEFNDHTVIIVEDNPGRTFHASEANVKHFCWEDIENDLGENAWIIPRRTDCIRSFGFWKACQEKPDIIVTLDDDCYPVSESFLETHFQKLTTLAVSEAWVSTVRGFFPRGMPYYTKQREIECVVNHGLWTNVPDLDAVTQLVNTRLNMAVEVMDQVIPKGMYFPMCGMNLAFKPEVAPAMYFLLMGQDWPYDRFGDIWSGVFLKKICDHLGYGIKSGGPLIEHQRASNVWANLRKELPGYEVNETLWREVDKIVLSGTNFLECYKELSLRLPFRGGYWDTLRRAMRAWTELFEG